MNLRGKIFIAADRAGISRKMMPVFFTIQQLILSNEDGRTAAAYREIAEEFGFSESAVFRAIKKLVEAKWLIAETECRRYKMLKIGPVYRVIVDEADREADCEAENNAINIADLHQREADREAVSEHTGVSRLRRSSPAFDIPSPVVKVLNQENKSARKPTAPIILDHVEFMNDYNRLCPRLIQCRTFNGKRKKLFSTAF